MKVSRPEGETPQARFAQLLKHLSQVPKTEVDAKRAQERAAKDARKRRKPA